MKASPRDWLLLACLGLIWGASFPTTRVATEAFEPLSLAALRLVIGAAALGFVLIMRGEWLPPLSERRFWLFAIGGAIFTNAAPFTLLSWAQRHVDSGLAGVAVATVPLFVLPLAHVFVAGERMTWRKIVGFLIGFTGIVVLIGPDVLAGIGGEATIALAQLACIATAFCYASGSIIAKKAPQLGLLRFGAASLILAALMMTPAALIAEGAPDITASTSGLIAVLYLGLIPTGLATVFLLTVINSAGPSFLSLVNYQVPIWAVIFGATFLGERVGWELGAALLLIFVGLAIGQGLVGMRRRGHAQG